jgi:hypothetical protein
MMMLSDAFARYIGEFRRPCGKKRSEIITDLNKRKEYSHIQSVNTRGRDKNKYRPSYIQKNKEKKL